VRFAMRERLGPVLAVGLVVAAAPACVLAVFGHVQIDPTAQVHFLAVGLTAAITAAAAGVLTYAGWRRSDSRTVVVGGAFSVMAALLALHGFSTPGVLVGNNGVVSLTGGVTLPVGGAMLVISTLPLPRRFSRVKAMLQLLAALLVLIIGLGASAILFPSLVPSVPTEGSPLALGVLGAGLGCFAIVSLRALRTFMLTRRLLDLTVLVGLVWLATALVPALTMGWYDLGWWMGHELELDGIVAVGLAVALDLTCPRQSRPLAGDLSAVELVLAEEYFLGSHVRALTRRLAAKDPSTEQHTRRVALLAVQIGERLGLSRRHLRRLAVGALVHDIGKLAVPDSILKKPAPLSAEEYAIIKRHPAWGQELLATVGGFPSSVRALVHDHHERLDGQGYPRGLSGSDLPLVTRILTVCDVYDALISSRVYRPPFTGEQAIALLREEAGRAYDATCIYALEQVLRLQPAGAAAQERRPRPVPALPSAAGVSGLPS
jgi:hypothetical protein